MTKEVLKEIQEQEILVHFIYNKHFKNKRVDVDKLITKNIFLPNKGGVSLQRATYCSEVKCKYIAKRNVNDRLFTGFFIFKKNWFEKVKIDYIHNERAEFEAEIVSTPLDKNNKYLPINQKVFINSHGNPSHADLKYINPAVKGNESPNTAIRSFSRKLSKVCKLIIDNNFTEDNYSGMKFKEVI